MIQDNKEEILIDLEELKKNNLNEGFHRMFATSIELMLGQMFGHSSLHALTSMIKGKPRDVKSFAKTIGHEKKYMDALKKHGLDNPKTFKVKSRLDKAVKGFEKTTGIKWPFK
tara:strand:- start:1094 stop:1432 length:339 start_codon:yes stop_codon:yes gene_type:complete